MSAVGDQTYALNRYVNETRRLYRTMDKALAENPSGYLVGDHLTIADIAIWPWTTAYSKGLPISKASVCEALTDCVLQSTVAYPRLTSSLMSRTGCTGSSHVLGSRRGAMCRILISTSSSPRCRTKN